MPVPKATRGGYHSGLRPLAIHSGQARVMGRRGAGALAGQQGSPVPSIIQVAQHHINGGHHTGLTTKTHPVRQPSSNRIARISYEGLGRMANVLKSRRLIRSTAPANYLRDCDTQRQRPRTIRRHPGRHAPLAADCYCRCSPSGEPTRGGATPMPLVDSFSEEVRPACALAELGGSRQRWSRTRKEGKEGDERGFC